MEGTVLIVIPRVLAVFRYGVFKWDIEAMHEAQGGLVVRRSYGHISQCVDAKSIL